jgi:hypothetical protein
MDVKTPRFGFKILDNTYTYYYLAIKKKKSQSKKGPKL